MSTSASVLSIGDAVLDCACRTLTGPTGTIVVDVAAYVILRVLMSRPGHVFTTQELISSVWNIPMTEPENPIQAIRERVSRARWALHRVGVTGRRLVAQREEGYALLGEHRVGRGFKPADAAAIDRIMALRPDLPTLAAELEAAAADRQRIAA